MSVSKVYNPAEVENKWYSYWLEHRFFHAVPDPSKEPFTIVIPPPNVTGVLHMGHMLNNTIQDILVRKARMEGKSACWVPGTDHASIATEAKVVAKLKEEGINKSDLSREEFLKHAWVWKEKYGGIILEQLKKLGASCDWERTRFTMEDDLSAAVIEVFVKLHEKGLIYRGARMINWDPQGKTALSDEEVIYKEVNSKLYYIKYPSAEGNGFLTVATTRPETIMGDVAICVNPNDERYKNLIGKKFLVPLVNRPIPVIADEYVDMEFGTGCLKITPAHDLNDYNLGLKHHLEIIDVLNADGTISAAAGIYVGEDRFVVRKKIAKELEANDYLAEAKDIVNKVGTSERTGAVVEPRISTQWFCSMKEMAKPALENVVNGNIKLHPNKFINTYKHWMENVQDWCISRQLWWGQRIPAYYLKDGRFVVAKSESEALEKAKALTQDPLLTTQDLKQDEDVLDTWFSSWLWPISVFDGFKDPENADFKYFYPTNDLVTAPEILFFWVARMIMAGYEFKGELPFKNVYLTGIVRDKQGRKMSKSLGNSPDPLGLIEKYSADGVRIGMLLSSPAGNDLLFDEKLCEQGRNFTNKIWNAYRLIQGWQISPSPSVLISGHEASGTSYWRGSDEFAIKWMRNRLLLAIDTIDDHFKKYRISDALMTMYKLIWDDYCSWYLEMIKPEFGNPIDQETYFETKKIFETILKIAHPFVPFITEEIWHELEERNENNCIIIAEYPRIKDFDEYHINLLDNSSHLEESQAFFEIVNYIRNYRNEKQLSPKDSLELFIKTIRQDFYGSCENILKRLVNLSNISFVIEKPYNTIGFTYKGDEFFIPLPQILDIEKERANALKEIEYLRGFLISVEKKLSNEKFVSNAPKDVLEKERTKQKDAEEKIKSLEETLAMLNLQ